jgi:hypothetical protein
MQVAMVGHCAARRYLNKVNGVGIGMYQFTKKAGR